MQFQTEYENAVSKATVFLIRELNHASDAEQMALHMPKKATAELGLADKAQEDAWRICREAMRRPEFEHLRLTVFGEYAKRMGWGTEKPVIVAGRSYPLGYHVR